MIITFEIINIEDTTSADLTYFRGHSRQRGRGFGALAQTLGRTAISKYVVPAAKRIGADLLGYAAPKIGDALTRKKKIKTFAKDVGSKTIRKQLGGGKKKASIKKKAKQHVHFTNSCLEIFDIDHYFLSCTRTVP